MHCASGYICGQLCGCISCVQSVLLLELQIKKGGGRLWCGSRGVVDGCGAGRGVVDSCGAGQEGWWTCECTWSGSVQGIWAGVWNYKLVFPWPTQLRSHAGMTSQRSPGSDH